jgi:hypothetical protein
MLSRSRRFVLLAIVTTLPWFGWLAYVHAAAPGSDLQNRFDHESNSVHKAKLFEKLGDEQLSGIRRAAAASDYNSVGEIMEKYRDNARATLEALKREHPNAEHQLNGYKQLQIHIRKTLRDLTEIVLLAPPEYKPPLQIVQQDLAVLDDELLRSLFPSRPVVPAAAPDNPRSEDATPPQNAPVAGGSVLEQSPTGNAQAASSTPSESSSNTNSGVGSGTKTEAHADAIPPARSGSPSGEDSVESTQEKSDMNIKDCLVTAVVTCGLAISSCAQLHAQFEQKDYLSPLESDKIRDAETTNERLRLFVTFADDRLKKFQYELQHPSSNRHGELLNALMNGYVGCLDDAADLMQLGIEKQENIRAGIDLMSTRSKEFLEALNKIAADKIDIDIYKDNLDDAIQGTKDAISDSEKAKKAVAPPPVRRKN